MNEQIQKMMKNLGLTEQEARELLADDAKVDKGEKMAFDLTPEQEKNAKKARSTGTKKPTAYKFENRKRKENPEKRDIMTWILDLFKGLTTDGLVADAELVNPERQVDFHIGSNHYSLTLTCHRPPKEGKG